MKRIFLLGVTALALTAAGPTKKMKTYRVVGEKAQGALTLISVPRTAAIKRPTIKSNNDYLIALANLSSKTIEYLRTGQGGNWGGWVHIAPIGRNCSGSYSDCVRNHNFTALFVTQCTNPPMNVQVATAPDAQGHATGAQFSVNPDCNYAGGVLGLTD